MVYGLCNEDFVSYAYDCRGMIDVDEYDVCLEWARNNGNDGFDTPEEFARYHSLVIIDM